MCEFRRKLDLCNVGPTAVAVFIAFGVYSNRDIIFQPDTGGYSMRNWESQRVAKLTGSGSGIESRGLTKIKNEAETGIRNDTGIRIEGCIGIRY
ncbi:hypothetical protein EVAR_102403_1 [Eumeta japonica]|uniref:Uncharacterized protein n=1 Tax=Eumeta variegata TaxID=151549 RepID=A0A4C1SLM0_EUMVA|nr:hypothetical protein EVAR_102403_1 [Eumeta japonica]